MSFFSDKLAQLTQKRSTQRNIVFMLRIVFVLFTTIAVFSILFHAVMAYEGKNHSFITGVYWTLTVMTTLGFGDITFSTDLGKLFSIIVLLSGILLLVSLLPFAFNQLIYAPWIQAQKKLMTPRKVAQDSYDHIIIISSSPIALNLMEDLKNYGIRSILLCQEPNVAMNLIDQGFEVIVGEYDSGETYNNLRLNNAKMLLALDTDVKNTNIVFTARELNKNIPIVACAHNTDAIDILELAGSTYVFPFRRLLGEALARRVLNSNSRCSIISQFDELVVAEAPIMRSHLVGKSIRQAAIRNSSGATIVGIWERGKFSLPHADTIFTDTMVLVIAGTKVQVEAINKLIGPNDTKFENQPVLILGYGSVGQAAARQLQASKREFFVLDKQGKTSDNYIKGDASDLNMLEKAGFRSATSVIITTHDDDTNIYLTLYCRRLRKDIQIISRATLDRNVGILHAAGADLVLSQASIVTNNILNILSPGKVTMLADGLNFFRTNIGDSLINTPLATSGIRDKSHCSVVGLRDTNGTVHINPDPNHVFTKGEEIFLIGDSKSQKQFYEIFGNNANI